MSGERSQVNGADENSFELSWADEVFFKENKLHKCTILKRYNDKFSISSYYAALMMAPCKACISQGFWKFQDVFFPQIMFFTFFCYISDEIGGHVSAQALILDKCDD